MYKILVPIDGSEHSQKALHIAGDLAEKYGGSIYLLHVLTQPQATDETSMGATKKAARAIIEAVIKRLLARSIDFQVLPLAIGNPVDAILTASEKVKVSAIVMGSRGISVRVPLDNIFGSVSHAVFERANCTCISVK